MHSLTLSLKTNSFLFPPEAQGLEVMGSTLCFLSLLELFDESHVPCQMSKHKQKSAPNCLPGQNEAKPSRDICELQGHNLLLKVPFNCGTGGRRQGVMCIKEFEVN